MVDVTGGQDGASRLQIPTFDEIKDILKRGDLVLFDGEGHVSIYVGNGLMIDAPRTGEQVRLLPLDTDWYAANYDGALRAAANDSRPEDRVAVMAPGAVGPGRSVTRVSSLPRINGVMNPPTRHD